MRKYRLGCLIMSDTPIFYWLNVCYLFSLRRVMPSMKHSGCVGAPGSHKSTLYFVINERSTAGLSA